MPNFSQEEIRRRFSTSTDFNEIFDAFEDAVVQRIDDVELYRLLFWNNSLTPEELCLFGEKLSQEFPQISYDVYMWLANVFELTYSMYDNYELAVEYYKKAASIKPSEPDPYLDAADCYEPDLNIPPVDVLIDFLKEGSEHVGNPKTVFQRLAYLYQLSGDFEMSEYYRRKADELGAPPSSGKTPPSEGGEGFPESDDIVPPSPS
jgi:tetratricopeptide (TPR) repeat protein